MESHVTYFEEARFVPKTADLEATLSCHARYRYAGNFEQITSDNEQN